MAKVISAAEASASRASRGRSIFGIVVTFRRAEGLGVVFDRLGEQDRPVDHLVVVDNDPSPESERIATGTRGKDAPTVDYLPQPENLGSAGGVAAGMERALELAAADDWILLLDDDDPPPTATIIGELERFGEGMLARDDRTGAVGLAGARFDFKRGRLRRVPDEELVGPVLVDYVPMGHVAMYRASVVREVGPYLAPLFFASDIEYGLRVRKAGYSIYVPGPMLRRRREDTGRLGIVIKPRVGLSEIDWRRYYSLRNTIYVLRSYGHPGAALRVTAGRGIGKPVANLVVTPRRALSHLVLNARACWHGWTGRLGRVVEPDGRSRRDRGAR